MKKNISTILVASAMLLSFTANANSEKHEEHKAKRKAQHEICAKEANEKGLKGKERKEAVKACMQAAKAEMKSAKDAEKSSEPVTK